MIKQIRKFFSVLVACSIFVLVFMGTQEAGIIAFRFIMAKQQMDISHAAFTVQNIKSFYHEVQVSSHQLLMLAMELPTTVMMLIMTALYFKGNFRKLFKIANPKKMMKLLLFGVTGYLVLFTVINIIPWPNSWIEVNNKAAGSVLNRDSVMMKILTTGMLAPICEELLFRGIILNKASSINPVVGIIISSVMFSLAHGNILQCIYTFVLGVMFCCIVKKCKSLTPSILLHMMVNTNAIILSLI